ncbi:MAG TPA: nucleotide pyrophosphatase/phosphodiesterase family protein, partial [Vicinamibacterales bacterium]
WWFNMYSSAEWSVTPRPIYRADGLKVVDIYSHPADIRDRVVAKHGAFPFFNFWGPQAGIQSSEWIADASISVDTWYSPTLLLIYLPHLDYNLQRLGPDDPKIREDVRAIDAVCGKLIAHCRERGRRIIAVSEYGLVPVSAPVHINRVLREAGLLAIRDELGTDTLDAGASEAFAVADHQVAHVYVRNPARIGEVASLLRSTSGIDLVLDRNEQRGLGLDHDRSGELVAISARDRWFTYYFWLDDRQAPDYARTVDIHRKPGYDPAELFVDPKLAAPKLTVAATLAKKALGFRYLMNVIPLDASMVKGSHGRITESVDDGPLLISSRRDGVKAETLESTAVRDAILEHLFD